MTLDIFTIGNLEQNFLRKRNEAMKKSRADLVMLLNSDIQVSNYRKSIGLFHRDPKLFAVTFSPSSSEGNKIVPADFANGGSSIYRRRIWNKIGGIDLMFEPYWWDDVDYSYRAKKAGFHILQDGRIKVKQVKEMGTNILKRNLKSILIQRRNMLLFLRIHNPKQYLKSFFNPSLAPFIPWAEIRYRQYHGRK